jgi:ketosteroid isomerase-like protein
MRFSAALLGRPTVAVWNLPIQRTAAGWDHDEMDRDQVMRWVDGYIDAWRAEDPQGVERLFTDDVRYRRSPYEESEVGHDAVKAFWLDDAGETFAVRAMPVAVEGHSAVVRLDVAYGEPAQQEYRDLWVLQFADDGRVSDFEEWAYWPGKPYTASEQ